MKANHTYRAIWNELFKTRFTVSGIARSHGKRNSRAVRLALPMALFTANAIADGTPATVVPAGGQTTAYTSANGVPVVNINAANGAGLSHNQYSRYDVNSNGLVLNNGNMNQLERASQLAGSVLANPNLNREANIILNEVVSTSRSTLAGFTEVVGGKADIVVANPNGITCSGCGFINTDRATITTGTPQFSGSGGLAGFNINRGDILVEGSGINASGQQILDLVARSIKVDGPITTSSSGSLQLAAGPNTWNYETRDVSGNAAGSGTVPAYAIDSSTLGGMYAGRIRLIATEAGVGVNMLGEAAASSDDFSINASGQVAIQTRLSAQRDLSVATTGSSADITLATANTNLSAGNDLTISTAAGGGGSIDNEGLLLAGGRLTVTADATIANGANAAMAGLEELEVNAATGDINNAGWMYSEGQLTGHADNGTFANTGSGTVWSDGSITIYADTFVNNNWIQTAGDLTVSTTTRFSNELEGARTLTKQDDDSTATYSGYSKLHSSKESGTHVYFDNVYSWYENKQVKQAFNREVPSSGDKPVAMVAGHDMTINAGAGALNNTGAVLSAGNNLTITGTGVLNNEALYLDTNLYQKRYGYHEWWDACFITCDDNVNFYAVTTDEQFAAGYPHYVDADVVWPDPNWTWVAYSDGSSPSWGDGRNLAQSTATWIFQGQVAGQTETVRDGVIHAGAAITVSGGNLNNNGSRIEGTPGGYAQGDDTKASVPTNPNGYFVPARNSSARYLIETNPRYGLGSDYDGSDRLLKSFGIDPETTIKRLGDANYEAYLVRQQLISQTGNAVLNGYVNEAKQMAALMDQAVDEGKNLGLTMGKALTGDQVANLTRDIVWMVETTVNGQTVLQPIVYLSPESRQAIVSGAVMAGKEINMTVESLTNTGGTISGDKTLTVTSRDDITNVSGNIKGGDISLDSTEGSIIHRTFSEGHGDISSDYRTTIGKTANIDATGSLNMKSKSDILIEGADVKAGGSASLNAGGDITADTIVDKNTTTTRTSGSKGFLTKTGPTTTTGTTEKNIGSIITSGGDLKLTSGGDTTLAGTTAKIGGNLNVDTGGDFDILSRQDKTTLHSETTTTGFGVGGGLWGTERITVDDFTGINFGSTINVFGNTDITSGGDMTLQGSDLKSGGSGTIAAGSVLVEQGLNERHRVTKTETTTFLSTGGGNDSHSGAAASTTSGNAAAEASASAGAGVSESHEFNLMEKRTTTVDHEKRTGVGSTLTTGGDLEVKARDEVSVTGSNVEAAGELEIEARKIEILAGENKETTSTTSKSTKIGIYTDSKADASASADSDATGMSASARAEAEAKAEADSSVTIGARTESSLDATTTVTHTSSSLKSGADVKLTAEDEAKFAGAKVEAGDNLVIKAKDITNLAVEDSTITTSERTTRTAGLYFDGNASAEAKGSAKAGPGTVSASGGASAGVEASAGMHYSQEQKTGDQGETTNVVNTFKAGGDITRTATGTITDQGTQLEAGGDLTQTATTLHEIAAEDKTWSNDSSETHDAKIGVYGSGSYSGDAGVQKSPLGSGGYGEDLGPEASIGIKAKYSYEKTIESWTNTSAVTSRYKAGGNISSTTTDKTTLIGTQFEAGKNVTIGAKSLDYQAAHDTSSSSSETRSAEAEGKLKLTGTTGVEVGGGYDQNKSSSTSTTARAGGITAGGDVRITTQDDARVEGTDITAGNTAAIKSETGKVTIDAAKSSTHEESSGFNINAGFGSTRTSPKGGEAAGKSENESMTTLDGGYSSSQADSTNEKGATIKARNVEVSAEKDVTMHGSQIEAGEEAAVTTQSGDVRLLEAINSESSSSIEVSGNATGMRLLKPEGDKSQAQYGGFNLNAENEEWLSGQATSITSGGNITVRARNILFQDAELSADGTKNIEGAISEQALTNEKSGMKVDFGIDFLRKKKTSAEE